MKYSKPALLVATALNTCLVSANEGDVIEKIRLGNHEDFLRIVFDLSKPVEYRTELENNHLVLVIPESDQSVDLHPPNFYGTLISGMHSIPAAGNLRITFDLKTPVEYKSFLLGPMEQRGDRLVIDFYPKPGDSPVQETVSDIPAKDEATAVVTSTESDHTEPASQTGFPENGNAAAGYSSTYNPIEETIDNDTRQDLTGNISLDSRGFFHGPLFQDQERHNTSLVFELDYYRSWDSEQKSFTFKPFFRVDSADSERSHADIRELLWRFTYEEHELKIGVGKVFWGVAESQHLVDIINQTDLVENVDGEDKLGQPMLNLTFIKDWGTLDLFVLPYFRERTFPGEEGRLRSRFVIDDDHPIYESSAEENHVDAAVRWSKIVGDWDVGLAHFSGTSREPLFVPTLTGSGAVELLPYYQQIDQTSLDIQATKGDWLWKLEAIYNANDLDDYFATVGGFEYTIVGINQSATDLGLLMEYHYDNRDEMSTPGFENDLFLGMRWTLNDVDSTELLAGSVVDLDNQAVFTTLETSKRFWRTWKITLEARLFSNYEPTDVLYDFRDDDYIELQITKYF